MSARKKAPAMRAEFERLELLIQRSWTLASEERTEWRDALREFRHALDRVNEPRRLAFAWGVGTVEGKRANVASDRAWLVEGEASQLTIRIQRPISDLEVSVDPPFVMIGVYVGTQAELWGGSTRKVVCGVTVPPGIDVTVQVEWPKP